MEVRKKDSKVPRYRTVPSFCIHTQNHFSRKERFDPRQHAMPHFTYFSPAQSYTAMYNTSNPNPTTNSCSHLTHSLNKPSIASLIIPKSSCLPGHTSWCGVSFGSSVLFKLYPQIPSTRSYTTTRKKMEVNKRSNLRLLPGDNDS
jgi:hypothetical protein